MPSIPIYALSSKGQNLSRLGSTFTYRFKTPLQIPSGVECTLSLYQASLWYVQPNISAALGNNTVQFSFANLGGNDGDYTEGDGDDGEDFNDDPYAPFAASESNTGSNTGSNTAPDIGSNTESNTASDPDAIVYTCVFDDGLYSLEELQNAFKRKIAALDSDLTGDEITLIPDNAQQKLIINVTPTVSSGDITVWFRSSAFTMRNLLGYELNETEIVTV